MNAFVLLCVFCLACSIGGAPVRVVKGRDFPVESVKFVKEGMAPAQVEKILGPPVAVTTEGQLTLWRYFFRERKDDVVRLLGLIPVRRALAVWETEAVVVLAENRVREIRISESRTR